MKRWGDGAEDRKESWRRFGEALSQFGYDPWEEQMVILFDLVYRLKSENKDQRRMSII